MNALPILSLGLAAGLVSGAVIAVILLVDYAASSGRERMAKATVLALGTIGPGALFLLATGGVA